MVVIMNLVGTTVVFEAQLICRERLCFEGGVGGLVEGRAVLSLPFLQPL